MHVSIGTYKICYKYTQLLTTKIMQLLKFHFNTYLTQIHKHRITYNKINVA
jgi:hypothetical protein